LAKKHHIGRDKQMNNIIEWYWIITDNGEAPFKPTNAIIELDKRKYRQLFDYSNKSKGLKNLSIKDGETVLFYQGGGQNGFYYQGKYINAACTCDTIRFQCRAIDPPILLDTLRELRNDNALELQYPTMSVPGKCYPITKDTYNSYINAAGNCDTNDDNISESEELYWIVTDNGECPFNPKNGKIVLNKETYINLLKYTKPRSIKDGETILFYQGKGQNILHCNGFFYTGKYSESESTETEIVVTECEEIAPISISKLRNLDKANKLTLKYKNMSVPGKCYPITKKDYDSYILAGQTDYEPGECENVETNEKSETITKNRNSVYRRGNYTKQECINLLYKYRNSHEIPSEFYRGDNDESKIITWRGRAKDFDQSYSDIIATELLKKENLEWLKSISVDNPYLDKSYFPDTHSRNSNFNPNKSNREEAYIVKDLIKNKDCAFFDEQIPLMNLGKMNIDLIRFDINNTEKPTIQIMELKRPDIDNYSETLLRCVLEIYTYRKVINDDKLKNDFLAKVKRIRDEQSCEKANELDEELLCFIDQNFPDLKAADIIIEACIFIAKDNTQYRKLLPEENYYQSEVVKLMKELKIGAYCYEYKNMECKKDFRSITTCERIQLA
jgi:hypothetical protein